MRIFYFPAYLASIAARYPRLTLSISVILTVISLFFAVRIELRNDLVELLPDHIPEVRVIRDVLYKSGGLGYQSVMVSSQNQASNRAFLKALKSKLQNLFRAPGAVPFADNMQDQYVRLGGMYRDIFHYARNPSPYWKRQLNTQIEHFHLAPMVEYSFTGYDLSFFKRNQLLMVSTQDLKTIHKRIAKKVKYEVRKQQLGDMSLLDDDMKPKDPGIDLSDIRKKYASKINSFPTRIEVKEGDKWFAALMVRPRGIATDIIFTKEFVKGLKDTVAALKKDPRFKQIEVDFIGGFTGTLREVDGVANDLLTSISSTIVLLLVLLVIFFRRIHVLWLIPIPLGIGFALTYAFAYLAIGYLNTATGFIGVLLLGLGIDYGIYLAHRYFQERAEGKTPEQAIADCYFWTGKGVATAAVTTAVGFFALLLTRFRGFSQFGLIAGMGIILCLIVMSSVLPALLVLLERFRPQKDVPSLFKKPDVGKAFPFSGGFVVLAFVMIAGAVVYFPKVKFESNMKRLGFQDNGLIQQTQKWQRFDKIFPQSGMNPIVFLTKTEAQSRFAQEELMRRSRMERKAFPKKKPEHIGIRQVLSAFQFVPQKQAEKVAVLKRIKELLKRNQVQDFLDDPKFEKVYKEYKPLLETNGFTATDLPLYLQRDLVLYDKDRFDKVAGYLVVVVSGYDLSDGEQAHVLHNQLKDLTYKPTKGAAGQSQLLAPSGEPIIFAELLQVIKVDSYRAILVSLLAVLLLVFIDLRSTKLTLLSLWPLATGLLGVSILLVLFDVRLNMFNMVVLPALLGINVDAGVHMLHRYREDPEIGAFGVQIDLLGAITMASLTTVISFASLILAHHQGMKSVGSLAIAGLATGLLAALLFLPALMQLVFQWFPLTRTIERD